jgi:hypothetical protein
VIPRLYEREVVRAHRLETSSVLISKGSILNRVNGTRRSKVDGARARNSRRRCIVRPLRSDGRVTDSEEEYLNSMREAEVVLRVSVSRLGKELLERGGLALLDENVTRSTGHTLTLVVRYDGVVSPDTVGVVTAEGRSLLSDEVVGGGGARRLRVTSALDHEKLVPVAEGEVNAHLVIRERSGREGNTTITREEERKREVESVRRDGLGRLMRVREVIKVTNHISVTIVLTSGDGEGSPEIEVIVVKTGSDEVVEGNRALAYEVMHQVASPANTAVITERGVSNKLYGRNRDTEPSV